MGKVCTWCVCGILALFIAGCVLSAPAMARLGPFGLLKGRVLDADTMQPVPKASLTFKAEGVSLEIRDEVTASDQLGRFRFSPLYVGPGALIIEADGYHTLRTVVVIKNTGAVAMVEIDEWSPRRGPFAAVSGGPRDHSQQRSPGMISSRIQSRRNLTGDDNLLDDSEKELQAQTVLKKKDDSDLVFLVQKLDRDRKAGHIVSKKQGTTRSIDHLYSPELLHQPHQFSSGDGQSETYVIIEPEELPPDGLTDITQPSEQQSAIPFEYSHRYPHSENEIPDFIIEQAQKEETREPESARLPGTIWQNEFSIETSAQPPVTLHNGQGQAEREAPDALPDAQDLIKNADNNSKYQDSKYQESTTSPEKTISDQERLQHTGGWERIGSPAEQNSSAGQSLSGDQEQNEQGLTVISLLDLTTSRPLKNASVRLNGIEAESLGGGHFRLPLAEPGQHYLVVTLDGYEEIRDVIRIGNEPEHYTMYLKSSQ